MKSPFPGMDPYLEARRSNVHPSLLYLIQEVLQPVLPSGLRARTEERVVLEEETGDPIKSYRSDIAVIEIGQPQRLPAASSSGVLAPEPVFVKFFDEPIVDRFVQIIDTHEGNRVVTVIELLSPGNKKQNGELNEQYLRNLKDYQSAHVNVAEIDLLRSERENLQYSQANLPAHRRTPYLVGVCRADAWGWEVYPIELRKRLPAVPIPLRKDDPDVLLDLQPLIDRVYAAGGHDDIDYSKPAKPPLEGEDAAWAEELLRAAGKR